MASGGGITVELRGLDELRGKLKHSKADKPVRNFLDRGAIYMQGKARKNAPTDTGRLKNSIGIDKPSTRLRSIGPSVDYGEAVEFGTSPHFPPLNALWGWSKRHGGIDPFALQQAIGMWGTEAQPYMEPAAKDTEKFMVTIIPVLAAEIESAFA